MFIILDAFRVVRLAFHLRVVFSAFLISKKDESEQRVLVSFLTGYNSTHSKCLVCKLIQPVCIHHNAYNIW